MFRKVIPPSESKIRIDENSPGIKYFWSNAVPLAASWFVILFLCAWLGGWFLGEKSVIHQILSMHSLKQSQLFSIFWLAGWTVGGIWAACTLLMYLRPTMPAELTIENNELTYNTGLMRPQMSFSRGTRKKIKDIYPTIFRKEYKMHLGSISNVKTERIEGDLKLTLDYNMKRIEIGNTLS